MSYAIPDQVYVSLAASRYYPPGILNEDADVSEIGIKPMSARDEYQFNNPSALMNGKAVIDVIKNCVPEVLRPQNLCVNDIEILLLGIYKASGHETYDISVKCPSCDKKGEIQRNIEHCLDNVTKITNNTTYSLPSGVVIHVRPNSWDRATKVARVAFEQQKLSMSVQSGALEHLSEQEKIDTFMESYSNMVDLNFQIVLDGINHVETPDGNKVHTKSHIKEFINTLNKDQISELKDMTETVNDIGVEKVIEVECPHCQHQWTEKGQRFDPSYFFE